MKSRYIALAAGLALALPGVFAIAQTITVPQVQSIGPTDLIQIIPRGQPSAQSQYAIAGLIGNYSETLGGNNPENALVGGDSTTNLWQRATTGASVTTATTYGGPDRWAYWSGTATAMTVSRTTTAGDLPASLTYKSGFKMARTSGQTGVLPVCMLQALTTANSLQFSGQTAEIDFHATPGSNFSAASNVMTAYLVSGTGTDESAAFAAFTVNGGGGGTPGFTGGVATGVAVTLLTGSNNRYSVAIPVPAATTQVAVALCFTPVGTASTNDYIAFSGIQLTRNSALTAAAGTAGVALAPNDTRAKAFARRPQSLENVLQYYYFYKITESTTVIGQRALCAVSTTSLAVCQIKFPVPMRIAPTMTYTSGFALTGSAQTGANVCAITRTSTTLTSAAATNEIVPIDCTSSAAFGAAGTAAQLYDLGTNSSTGIINASAEL